MPRFCRNVPDDDPFTVRGGQNVFFSFWKTGSPSSSQHTASPSIRQDRSRSPSTAWTISGKRLAQSGPLRWVLGDWQINGLLLLQTGRPLDITYPNTSLNAPGNNNQPNLIGAGQPAVL